MKLPMVEPRPQLHPLWAVTRLVPILMCLAVLVSGCSSSGQPGGSTGRPHATAIPTVSLTPLSMQQAWGTGVHLRQLSLDLGDRYFEPYAQHDGITDDGQVCGSTAPKQPQAVNRSQYVESVGLMDLQTGHVTLLTTMPAGYSLIACTVTGPWVIWTQTSGDLLTNPAAPWALKALNRQTGEARQLDPGPPPDAQSSSAPLASFLPEPDASNGRVVWTTYSQDTPGVTQTELYTLATGTKTVLAPNSSGPFISWPWVSWGDGSTQAIMFKNLQTAQQVQLPLSSSPTTGAFAGTSFVYTNSDYSQVTLVPSILAHPIVSYVVEDKQLDGSAFDEFPTLNARLISWVGPNAWLVFDRKLLRPVKIGIGVNGFGGFISSHYLVATPALTQADADAQRAGQPYNHVLVVLDTNTLP